MEEISSTIAMAYLGNMIYDESMIANCVDINGLEVVTSTRRFPEPVKSKPPLASVAIGDRNYSCSIPRGEVSSMAVAKDDNMKNGQDYLLTMVSNRGNSRGTSDGRNSKSRDGDSSLNSRENNIGAIQSIRKSYSWDPNLKSEVMEDLMSEFGSEKSRDNLMRPLVEVPPKLKIFCLDITPRWGFTSIRGRRNEMEDAVVALTSFLEVPAQMLIDAPITSATRKTLTGNLFGVYDGHGGIQVANYCRDRLHLALEDEVNILRNDFNNGNMKCDLKEYWEKTFLNCFHKVDDEIGGFNRGDQSIASASEASLPPVAPEAVGSTAVVAVVCPTHIIVANCGDSRAVLYRGKVPMPLSIDHKPNREDEYERIEAAGGKVINWDGYRVSGVLAVSRSIGDRYLRPYVISDPEIMFVPRTKEDDCLILASDGLWDVLTNEEVCDVARRRILLWHKKNGLTASPGEAVDPAAQDAADYLSRLALQRGSKDNISVIVVDLKAQRKFKTKS